MMNIESLYVNMDIALDNNEILTVQKLHGFKVKLEKKE